VKVVREPGRVVGDDALAGTRGSGQQLSYVLVEVAADPVNKRRSPIIDVRMSALVPRKLTDRLHGARVSPAVRDSPERDAVGGTDCCCA
jgi:diaminopimelate decarboxylase